MWPGWTGARIAPRVLVPCCSSHFFLLLFCYLPFLLALLIRQLVDWLVSVCTTLWTHKVLIQCSLLFLLRSCLYFLLFSCGWGACVFCDDREHRWGHGWDFRIPSAIPPPPPFSLSLTPPRGTRFPLSLTLVCCPAAVHRWLLGAHKAETHVAFIWNSSCVI